MKILHLMTIGLVAVAILCGCTGHRTSDPAEPDGDTVRVVIPEKKRNSRPGDAIPVIEIDDSIELNGMKG